MIVVDASVVVDLLKGPGSPAADRLAGLIRAGETLIAPHLLDAEVGHALRRWVLTRRVDVSRATAMLTAYSRLAIRRRPTIRLLPAAWQLRDNASFYDALYLALAEGLDAPLLTADRALAAVPDTNVEVEVVPARP